MHWLLTPLLLLQIVGDDFSYVVKRGDTLATISSRFGVEVQTLADANGLKASDRLQTGGVVLVNNRHIVPRPADVEILINIPQRMLFHFTPEGLSAYPIAAGRPGWYTRPGGFSVTSKEEKPTWDVPLSIQQEMRRAGKPVLTRVPPSPNNPLGDYWIGLSLGSIGIHGTNTPSSIYRLVTHGCMRLHPEDIRSLFGKVDIGTRGDVIYQPVLLARIDGNVYLEVHSDAYKIGPDPYPTVLDIARHEGYLDMLDLWLVQEVIRNHDGIAHNVTRR